MALGRGEMLVSGLGEALTMGRTVGPIVGRIVGRTVGRTVAIGRRVGVGRGFAVGAGRPGITFVSPALERPDRRIGW